MYRITCFVYLDIHIRYIHIFIYTCVFPTEYTRYTHIQSYLCVLIFFFVLFVCHSVPVRAISISLLGSFWGLDPLEMLHSYIAILAMDNGRRTSWLMLLMTCIPIVHMMWAWLLSSFYCASWYSWMLFLFLAWKVMEGSFLNSEYWMVKESPT